MSRLVIGRDGGPTVGAVASWGGMRVALVAAAVGLAAACADTPPDAGSSATRAAAPSADLAIEISRGQGTSADRYTLTCDPSGGTLPDAAGACARLAAVGDPFVPTPAGLMCTQVYGGPEVAVVRGRFRGRPLEASFNRRNGCEISRYRALMGVLGLP